MSEIKVRGVMLRAIEYKEADKLLSICTVENGLITATLKGCRKAGAKMSFAARPFLFAEYILAERQGKYTVTSCDPIESFLNVTTFGNIYAATAIVDILGEFGKSSESAPQQIVLALKALSALGDNDNAVLATYGVKAFDLAGYKLEFRHCVSCGKETEKPYFSFSDGGVLCGECALSTSVRVRSQTIENLKKAQLSSLEKVDFTIENESALHVLSLLSEFANYTLGYKLKGLSQYISVALSVPTVS